MARGRRSRQAPALFSFCFIDTPSKELLNFALLELGGNFGFNSNGFPCRRLCLNKGKNTRFPIGSGIRPLRLNLHLIPQLLHFCPWEEGSTGMAEAVFWQTCGKTKRCNLPSLTSNSFHLRRGRLELLIQ